MSCILTTSQNPCIYRSRSVRAIEAQRTPTEEALLKYQNTFFFLCAFAPLREVNSYIQLATPNDF
jgi:hypothetical protein